MGVSLASPTFAAEQDELDPQRADVPLVEIQGLAVPVDPVGAAAAPQVESPAWRKARQHYETARALLENKQYTRAIIELDAALKLVPTADYEVLLLMAQAKQAWGHLGEARLAAEYTAHCYPGRVGVHLLLGRLHRDQDNPEAAIANFRTVTLATQAAPEQGGGDPVDDPRVTVAWYELGECLAEAGYLAAAATAFEHFDRALWESYPDHRQDDELAAVLANNRQGAIERRLELLRRLGRPDELATAAQWIIDTRPEEPYLQRLYVRTLLDAGHAAQAFEFCRQRLMLPVGTENGGINAAVLPVILAIDTARAAGRLEAWVDELAKQVAAGSGDRPARDEAEAVQQVQVARDDLALHLARALGDTGDHGLSVILWRALARARPADANIAWAHARAVKETGDLSGALDALGAFVRQNSDEVEIPPERPASWMPNLAATADFMSLVTESTARGDCDFADYLVWGATAAAARASELAERLFAGALEDRPDFAPAHVAWGQMLLAEYRWEEARAHAEQALAFAPDSASAHLVKAEAHTGLDELEEAEQAYKAAAEHRPDEIEYVLALARHYHRTGNLLSAQRYLQQAWSMDRGLGGAVEELVDSYLEGGKLKIARVCLAEAEASPAPDDTLRRIRTVLRFATAPMQDEHLAELARQFAEFPRDVRTGLKLAAGLYLHRRYDEALDVLRRVEQCGPEDERAAHLLARVHLRRLEYEDAIAMLEELTSRYPRRLNALALLIDAYLADFQIEAAREALRRALALDLARGQRAAFRMQLLQTFLSFSEFDAARELVDQWIEAEPRQPAWVQEKLRVLVDGGHGDEAVELATERLETANAAFNELRDDVEELAGRYRETPDDAQLEAQLQALKRDFKAQLTELDERREAYVWACRATDRFAQAAQRARQWLAEEPNKKKLQEWLVELLLGAEEADDAWKVISTFDLTRMTRDDLVRVLTWRARCYALAGRRDEGVNELLSWLNHGYVRDGRDARQDLRGVLLGLLEDAGEFEYALRMCDAWLDEVPVGDPLARLEVLLLKRYVLQFAGREEEQGLILEEWLRVQPYHPTPNNDLGYTWADRGEHIERALEMIKRAVAAEPSNAAFLDSLGWAYYKLGEFDAARVYLSRAVRLRFGQDPVLYDHLGDTEYRLGDPDAARRQWQQALSLLDEQDGAEPAARQTVLRAALRAKLAALDQDEGPAVAPTVAEQQLKESL